MWLAGYSCSSTKHMSKYETQKRGLLMMEGADIYKNRGFYHPGTDYSKQHKKNMRKLKKRRR